ncbi:MAG: ribonuclease Z [Bacteroidales bacterium]
MVIFSVTILGSSSASPTSERNPTSQLINHREQFFLIDCGEGTQVQLRRNHIRFNRIEHIFISHLHGDHFFGLIGLISTMHLLGRKKELHIYSPPELEEIIQLQLRVSNTTLIYSLIFHSTQAENPEKIMENEHLEVITLPLNHRVQTTGFIFREKLDLRRIDTDAVKKHKIPYGNFEALKSGNDYTTLEGKLIRNKKLTTDPPSIRSYVYCSDTAYCEHVIPFIQGADLLYHETTFMADKSAAAAEKFHSTTLEAGTIAKKARVKKLIIGHFSARYDELQPLLDETKTIFHETNLAEEGMTFEV